MFLNSIYEKLWYFVKKNSSILNERIFLAKLLFIYLFIYLFSIGSSRDSKSRLLYYNLWCFLHGTCVHVCVCVYEWCDWTVVRNLKRQKIVKDRSSQNPPVLNIVHGLIFCRRLLKQQISKYLQTLIKKTSQKILKPLDLNKFAPTKAKTYLHQLISHS